MRSARPSVGLAEHEERAPELRVGRRELRIELDRLAELRRRLLERGVLGRHVVVGREVRLGDGDAREPDERRGVLRRERGSLAVLRFGHDEVVGVERRIARRERGVDG
jgi:hypothetical protein